MQAWKPSFVLTDEIYQVKMFSRDEHAGADAAGCVEARSEEPAGASHGQRLRGAWAKMYGKGRVFYTTLGHVEANWDKPEMQAMITGAIKWALGLVDADITPRPLR